MLMTLLREWRIYVFVFILILKSAKVFRSVVSCISDNLFIHFMNIFGILYIETSGMKVVLAWSLYIFSDNTEKLSTNSVWDYVVFISVNCEYPNKLPSCYLYKNPFLIFNLHGELECPRAPISHHPNIPKGRNFHQNIKKINLPTHFQEI